MHTALLWEHEGDAIRCRLCPNACRITKGHSGICGVRRNTAGVLVASTYGLVSSAAVDPIEKKPVFHYAPGSTVFSIGSVGCSMRCGHCQNWQISRAGPGDSARLRTLSAADVVDQARRHGCPGVAFTYNEPVIWAEYVCDVARECRKAGLFTVMVTNGYVTLGGLDLLGPLIDVWRVDLKGSRDETYRRLCGVRAVEPVRRAAVRAAREWGMHVEVVTNVVPTVNDSAEELREMAAWIADDLGPDTPWHITRFFPYLDFSDLRPTPLETLHFARSLGREAGLHFVYLGNIDEPDAGDTVCPRCGARVIARTGYTVLSEVSQGGGCPQCGRDLNIGG